MWNFVWWKLEKQRKIFEIHRRTNSMPSNWGKQTLCKTGCSKLLNNEHILGCDIANNNQQQTLIIYTMEALQKNSQLWTHKKKKHEKNKYVPSSGFWQCFDQLIHWYTCVSIRDNNKKKVFFYYISGTYN